MIEYLNSEETVWTFYEKELQKTSQTESKIEKEIKGKMMNYMWSWKVTIIRLIAG